MSKTTLTVCSSASFYPQVVAMSQKLEDIGIAVVLPKTARKMKEEGLTNVEAITDWTTAPTGYHGKSMLIREHFDVIAQGDGVLVANYEKHGKENYIGPNVLMEMAIAFYLNKHIYILNDKPVDSPLIDEILGLEPIFLQGDINLLINK